MGALPIVAITLTDLLSVAIVVAVQPIHCIGGCPYPAHLFIDELAKVGDVKNATSIVQVRIRKVFPEAFEYGKCDLSGIGVHDTPHSDSTERTTVLLFI